MIWILSLVKNLWLSFEPLTRNTLVLVWRQWTRDWPRSRGDQWRQRKEKQQEGLKQHKTQKLTVLEDTAIGWGKQAAQWRNARSLAVSSHWPSDFPMCDLAALWHVICSPQITSFSPQNFPVQTVYNNFISVYLKMTSRSRNKHSKEKLKNYMES